jgi:hypothetical protein
MRRHDWQAIAQRTLKVYEEALWDVGIGGRAAEQRSVRSGRPLEPEKSLLGRDRTT